MTRVLIVQHGDYAEAWRRLRAGGPETYRDQFSSVAHVAGLAPGHAVTTVTLHARPHDEALAPGLRSIGLAEAMPSAAQVAALFDGLSPERVICRTPNPAVLVECRRRRIATLPCFADIFVNSGPRAVLRNLRLRLLLAGRHLPCIANHGLNASRSLVRALRLPAARIVPWDWEALTPDPVAKEGMADPARPRLFFAGALSEAKGVGDCLEALAQLRAGGIDARLTLAGPGDLAPWRARASALGLDDDAMCFLGSIPHDAVRREMAAHDAVLVPSRHAYPEGMPNVIYEGLASRSALLVSDHPSFAGRIVDGRDGLVFRAGDARSLATAVRRLAGEAALYARLSRHAPEALAALKIGMDWTTLIDAFLADPADETGWVARNSLAVIAP